MNEHERMAPEGFRRLLMQGAALLMGRQIAAMVIGVLGIFVVTRALGPTAYGAYAASASFYLFALNFTQTSLSAFVVRSSQKLSRENYFALTTFAVALGLIAAALVIAASFFLAPWVQIEHFAAYVAVQIFCLPVQLAATVAGAQLDARFSYRPTAVIDLAGQAVFYGVGSLLILLGLGPWALIAAFVLQRLGECVYYHRAARYAPRFGWSRPLILETFKYYTTFSAATWLWHSKALVNPLVVGHFLGAAAVGQVNLSVRIVEVLSFVRGSAWRMAIPTLSRLGDDRPRLRAAVEQGIQLQLLGVGLPLWGFGCVAPFLLPWFYGRDWQPVLTLYPLLAVSSLTNCVFILHWATLTVSNRPRPFAMGNFLNAALFTIAAVLLTPRVGIVGLGLGEICGFLGYAALWNPVWSIVGALNLRLAALWWAAFAIGLLWPYVGLPAALAPIGLICLIPASVAELRSLATLATSALYKPARG